MSVVVTSFICDERACSPTLLEAVSTTNSLSDKVHKFQNSYFKEYRWKAGTILQKVYFLRGVVWDHDMKYAHDITFRTYIETTLFTLFYTFFLLHRRKHRALNERSCWLIEIKIRKTLQASAVSFIVLNLAEKAVLHILWIMVDFVKSALQNRQQIASNAEHF